MNDQESSVIMKWYQHLWREMSFERKVMSPGSDKLSLGHLNVCLVGKWIYEERKGKSGNTFLLIGTMLKIYGIIQRGNAEKNTVNNKLKELQHLVSGPIWESPRARVKKFKALKESEEEKVEKEEHLKKSVIREY